MGLHQQICVRFWENTKINLIASEKGKVYKGFGNFLTLYEIVLSMWLTVIFANVKDLENR